MKTAFNKVMSNTRKASTAQKTRVKSLALTRLSTTRPLAPAKKANESSAARDEAADEPKLIHLLQAATLTIRNGEDTDSKRGLCPPPSWGDEAGGRRRARTKGRGSAECTRMRRKLWRRRRRPSHSLRQAQARSQASPWPFGQSRWCPHRSSSVHK
eukprot:scaffold48005_cov31-Tisochrysis_lutea.AAC.4